MPKERTLKEMASMKEMSGKRKQRRMKKRAGNAFARLSNALSNSTDRG